MNDFVVVRVFDFHIILSKAVFLQASWAKLTKDCHLCLSRRISIQQNDTEIIFADPVDTQFCIIEAKLVVAFVIIVVKSELDVNFFFLPMGLC